jgi:hypothetical protein
MKTLQTLEALLFNKILEVAINCFYILWFYYLNKNKNKNKKVYELIEQKKIEIILINRNRIKPTNQH